MKTLRLFHSVARHRSFSQAAVEQGITQSAASQRISLLEKRLGVLLLDRSVRPLALTPAGDVFLRGCGDLLERYERLAQQVAGLKPALEGNVRVDAIYSAGIDLLNHVKEAFLARHGNVTVTIEYKRPEEVHEAVRQRRCDLGIISYPESLRDVAVIPLREEPMAVVCAPGHELARRRRIHASLLGAYAMVSFEPSLPAGRRIRKYLRDHAVSPEIIGTVFDNIDTIKSAVALTQEISILPKRTVMREVQSGTLAVVDLEPALTRPLGIIHRKARNSSPAFTAAAQAFVDSLLQQAGPGADLIAKLNEPSRRQLVGG